MNKLGKNAWIGLSVGATAGIGVLLFLVFYKNIKRGLCQRFSLPNRSDGLALLKSTDGPSTETVAHVFTVQGALDPGLKQVLSAEQQAQLKGQLDEVLKSVNLLQGEVASLRDGLQVMAVQIIQDVKSGLEESHKTARRRRLPPSRERNDSVSSSSIYFSASTGAASHYDGESEGGYMTANNESDYGGETDKEPDKDEEEECNTTVCTLRHQSSDTEAEDEEFPEHGSLCNMEAQPFPPPKNHCEKEGPRLCCDSKDTEAFNILEFLTGSGPASKNTGLSSEDEEEEEGADGMVKDEEGALVSGEKQ
ncbi:hypothetical protein AGOR_G00088140 [Albula goreensis]|uniref:Regulator of microtubule dynamics protein 3 n=1 Tax=Albula goreensis TaxID=1534307 RepID=A0A8T3DK81_9TELE|nr:hypothetical protein AGOR_G00088140 [Albula goreensis]